MSAVCKVTVKVTAKDITVPDSLDVKLNDGNETSIEATVSPADATDVEVKYASTDEAVATVDKDGKVQILQPGECDIVTTLTQEGKKVVEKKTHIKAFYEVEGITLDKTEGILTAGNAVTLNAAVLPEEIADETAVTWTSSDEKIATVDENGKVTAIAAGEATITANAGEKSATYKLTVQAKKVAQTATNKNTNKGNTSSSSNTAPASNPAPAQPAAPAEQPSQPTYEEPAQPAPDPQPEQPSNGDNGGSGNSGDKYGEGYDRWGGPVNSAPTDNAFSARKIFSRYPAVRDVLTVSFIFASSLSFFQSLLTLSLRDKGLRVVPRLAEKVRLDNCQGDCGIPQLIF